MNFKARLSAIILATLTVGVITFGLPGCGGGGPGPGELPDDGRPDGTVRVRFVFNHFCDLGGGAVGKLYDELVNLGGKLIEEQQVVNRELNFYLPPETGRYALVVEVEGKKVYEENFYSSTRDVQLDSVVCQ